MDILNPPKSYIDYRCYTHSLNGQELVSAQEKYYKKHSEQRGEIIRFFNWIQDQRQNWSLPYEQIEIREDDGKKHGRIVKAMIYDIEYWIENNVVKLRKIYIGEQGLFSGVLEIKKEVRDKKLESSGEYLEEPPF